MIRANHLIAFYGYFTTMMISPDWSYSFETLKDIPEMGKLKLLKFVNPIFDIG